MILHCQYQLELPFMSRRSSLHTDHLIEQLLLHFRPESQENLSLAPMYLSLLSLLFWALNWTKHWKIYRVNPNCSCRIICFFCMFQLSSSAPSEISLALDVLLRLSPVCGAFGLHLEWMLHNAIMVAFPWQLAVYFYCTSFGVIRSPEEKTAC